MLFSNDHNGNPKALSCLENFRMAFFSSFKRLPVIMIYPHDIQGKSPELDNKMTKITYYINIFSQLLL